jgi:lipopolysaccharide export system protein LptA
MALSLALICAAPTLAVAQEGKPCVLVFTGVARGADTTAARYVTTATGARYTYIGGGVDATCEGQGNRLLADSAEHYADRGELILINRVRYSEPRMNMQSDRMVYYTNEERLLATGNVRGRTNTGTRFTGPEIEYFRAKPGLRATPRWRAPGRPFVRMAPTDSTAPRRAATGAKAPADSVDLTADVVVSENDSLLFASGKVVIERPDMRATADSATMDQGTGFARLLRGPAITGRGERPFTLTGTVIDLWSREQRIERVRSDGAARVLSDSLTLTGDTIDLRIREQQMERVFAWGGRAEAVTPQQRMEADSIEILMPGQRLRELHALRRAVAYTEVDTALIVSEERDWISGDTIVALFDTAATGDTSSSARMRQVTASGSARAFYQMAPNGGQKGLPNISYNRGREIIVSFVDGEVTNVAVQDGASGILLEPFKSDTVRAAPPKPADKPPAKRP